MSRGSMLQAIAVGEAAGLRRGTTVRTHHRCVACRERRSLFLYRGVIKADRDHTLCLQCYRALRDSMRARRLSSVSSPRQSTIRKECH